MSIEPQPCRTCGKRIAIAPIQDGRWLPFEWDCYRFGQYPHNWPDGRTDRDLYYAVIRPTGTYLVRWDLDDFGGEIMGDDRSALGLPHAAIEFCRHRCSPPVGDPPWARF